MQLSQSASSLDNASAAQPAKRTSGPKSHHMRLERALGFLPGVKPIAGADALVAVYYHLKELVSLGGGGTENPGPTVQFFGSVVTLSDFAGAAAANDFATRCLTPKGARHLMRLYKEGAFERHYGSKGRPGMPAAALHAFAALQG